MSTNSRAQNLISDFLFRGSYIGAVPSILHQVVLRAVGFKLQIGKLCEDDYLLPGTFKSFSGKRKTVRRIALRKFYSYKLTQMENKSLK